jgi:aspartate/methionine/tyrosine aminotransferase
LIIPRESDLTSINPTIVQGKERNSHRLWLESQMFEWRKHTDMTMHESDVQPLKMSELLELADEELRADWDNLVLKYTETAGGIKLRREIANLYQGVDPSQVVVFAGADEAIWLFFTAMLRPGDHIVVLWPAYEALYQLAILAGAEVTLVPLEPDGWRVDVEKIQKAFRHNTKFLVTNFPHNPTGATIDRSIYNTLIEICNEHNVSLIGDEVYHLLEHKPEYRLAPAVEAHDSGVSIGVISKAYALSGLRIGWIAVKEPTILQKIKDLNGLAVPCKPAPSEVLATIALREKDKILARSHRIIDDNLPLLDEFFESYSDHFKWVRPRGATVGFPELIGMNVEKFTEEYAKREHVMVWPGMVFNYPGNNFRISYGRTWMPEGLRRLKHFADNYL